VTLAAIASDNVKVAGVQFKLNGANLGTELTTSPYTLVWDTSKVANGQVTLTAVARDSSGNQTTSAPVVITIQNDSQVTGYSVPGGGVQVFVLDAPQ
jgi:hypothetical protein